MGIDECEGCPDLLRMGLDDCRDDLVFGSEVVVVVDIPGGDVRRLGDVGERAPFDALLAQELGCSGYQPVSFPGRCPTAVAWLWGVGWQSLVSP